MREKFIQYTMALLLAGRPKRIDFVEDYIDDCIVLMASSFTFAFMFTFVHGPVSFVVR